MILKIFFVAVISVTLSFFGSKWINFLYGMKNAPLSFPEEISSRSQFRKIFLAGIFFICAMIFINLPPQKFFYLMAEIFFLALITCTDFEQYVIFDKMLIPFAVLEIFFAVSLNFELQNKILAAIFCGGIFLLIALLTSGIGGGDIKLVTILGFLFGTEKILNVMAVSCIFGGISAVILILAKKKDRKDFFAYGPYFALTAIYFICRDYIS